MNAIIDRKLTRFIWLWMLLTIAIIVVSFIVIVPNPVLGAAPEVFHENFSEPLNNTETASINLSATMGNIHISALKDLTRLIDADISHTGDVDFAVSGDKDKVVSINQRPQNELYQINIGSRLLPEDLPWDIGINPNLAVSLHIISGLGNNIYDLSDLQLAALDVTANVGTIELDLPATSNVYDVSVNAGVADTTVNLSKDTRANLKLSSELGNYVIHIPEDASVRITASREVGELTLPARFIRVSNNRSGYVGDSGVWETDGFNSADHQITIEFNGGLGNLSID